jgi:hypothetical protein
MTTTTIHLPSARLGLSERIATTVGIALVVWGTTGARPLIDHVEQARRVSVAAGIREREHAALRSLLPR